MEKGQAIIDSHLSATRDLALYDEEVRPCPQRIPDFYAKAEDRDLGILGSVLVQAEAIMNEEFHWLLGFLRQVPCLSGPQLSHL